MLPKRSPCQFHLRSILSIPSANVRLYLRPVSPPKRPTTPVPSVPKTDPTLTDPASLFSVDLKALVPSTQTPHNFKTYMCHFQGQHKLFSISNDSYVYSTPILKYSHRKLNMIGRQIKGLSVQEAILQMKFSVKKPAFTIMGVLERILRDAKPFSDASDHQWYLARVWVGKNHPKKGIKIHGRGMSGKLKRPYSHMKLMVKWSNAPLAPNRGNQYHGHGGFNVRLKPKKVQLPLYDRKVFAKSRKLFYDA